MDDQLSSITSVKRTFIDSKKTHRTFHARGHSLGFTTTTTMPPLEAAAPIGNYGHNISKIAPKDFTLTPIHKLAPMAFDLNRLPRDMPVSCDKKETDIDKIRMKLRR